MTETTARRPTWQEERRQDRLLQAQVNREDAAARAAIDRENEAARAKQRTAADKAKAERKAAAQRDRAARRQARADWAGAHAADLLLAPVIGAAITLSWTGMASYGTTGYGVVGLALPVLSEGGQWAFAAATTFTLHKHPEKSVLALRLGVVLFTLLGAGLNFNHGLEKGPGWAITMALVSASGITAHQLITAGPNWSRADRARTRAARQLARVKAAAEAKAPMLLEESGTGRTLFQAGVYTTKRRWFKTEVIFDPAATEKLAKPSPETVAADPVVPLPEAKQSPRPNAVTVAVKKSEFGTLSLTFTGAVTNPSSAPSDEGAKQQVSGQADGAGVPSSNPPSGPPATPVNEGGVPPSENAPKASRASRRGRAGKAAKLDQLIAGGGLTNSQIAERAKVSLSTVERRKADLKKAAQSGTVTSLTDRRAAGQRG